MKWDDRGILLGTRPFGESKCVATMLTLDHGLHAGMMRMTKKNTVLLQAGSIFEVHWQARLPEHLGSWSVEQVYSPLAHILSDPLALAALTSACALVQKMIPEREPHPNLFKRLFSLMKSFEFSWLGAYVAFEMTLLEAAGFRLDLSKCAATQGTEELIYISPRSGKAVSKQAGEPYKEKLLPLPPFMKSLSETSLIQENQAIEALRITSYFLKRYILGDQGPEMPQARDRFYERLRSC